MCPLIIQLIRRGDIDDIPNILDKEMPTREMFMHHMGSNLEQLIRLAAQHGRIEILQRCINYGVEVNILSTYGLHAIVEAASQGNDHVIEWLLEPWMESAVPIKGEQHSNELNLPQGWLYPSLHKAIQGQHVSTVKLLVESAWADVNACDNDNLRPLHVAANFIDKDNPEQRWRYEEIVKILLTAGAQVSELNPLTNTTPLYDAVSLDSHEATKRLIDNGADVFIPCTETKTTVLHIAAAAGFQETLRTMLDHYKLSEVDPCDFDVKDKDEITPLHAAAYGGHLECVRILIKKGLSLANVTNAGETVMDAIFKKFPHPIDFLTEILDEQVSFTDKSYNKVNLNFQIITARPSAQYKERRVKSISDLDVVFALIKSVRNFDQLAILQHPLLVTFLHYKYWRIILFTLPLFLCELFIGIFLIIHGICITSVASICNLVGSGLTFGMLLLMAIGLLTILDVVGFLLEKYDRIVYFRHTSIMKEQRKQLLLQTFTVVLIVCCIILTSCNSPPCEYEPIELSAIAALIVVYWLYILLAFRQIPLFEDYIFMFITVWKTVMKVLGIFVWLLIGFIFSFSVLLSHTDPFNTPWKAIVKTLLMMTGEYGYDDIFSLTNVNNFTVNNSTSEGNNNTFQLVVSEIVLLLFVLFISIVLMNLMVGLAVSDVEKLVRNSRSLRLRNQAFAAIQCRGLQYLFSCSRTSLGCRPTKPTHSITEVDLKSSSRVPWLEMSRDVKNTLYDLALKNSIRDDGYRRQAESPRDNIQETLATIQSSLATMQYSIDKIIAEQQRQNFQMVAERSQDQMATMKLMDSMDAY